MRKFTSLSLSVAVASVFSSAAHAAPEIYTFDYPSVTGSASPGTPTVANILPLGQFGQDGFAHIFAAGTYIRNDPKPGFSGNWLSSYPVTPSDAPASDGIESRVNNATFGYHLTNTSYAAFSADVLVGLGNTTTSGTNSYKRSIVSPGVDLNGDGILRASATNAQSAETAFQFGYESSSGIGWYIRGAAFGSNNPNVNNATTVTGTWTTKLLVDFAANNGDGAGTLLIKQLYDGNGVAVNDVFHLANASLSNVNLQLKRMNDPTLGGTATATDPTTWNGFFARVANNGGVDNISFESIAKTSYYVGAAGNWFTANNWFAGAPNAVDAIADLGNSGGTIYADADVTLGRLAFTGLNSQLVTGTGTITMQTTSGGATLDVSAGSHKLNIPLNVASNTTINVAAGATLKVSDPVTVQAGKTLTSTGTGTLTYESTVTVLTGGAINFASSQSLSALALGDSSNATLGGTSTVVTVGTLGLGAGSHIDVGANELRLNGSASEVRSALLDGSIHSSKADARHGLGYGDTGDGKVSIVYTLNGDANLDHNISFADLQLVAANYDNTTKTYAAGDFNYDGVKNFSDLLMLAKNYVLAGQDGKIIPDGASAAFSADWASAMALAPEPATLAVLGLPLAMLKRRRRA